MICPQILNASPRGPEKFFSRNGWCLAESMQQRRYLQSFKDWSLEDCISLVNVSLSTCQLFSEKRKFASWMNALLLLNDNLFCSVSVSRIVPGSTWSVLQVKIFGVGNLSVTSGARSSKAIASTLTRTMCKHGALGAISHLGQYKLPQAAADCSQ